MAQRETNVEFGKCSLKIDKDLIPEEEEAEVIPEENVKLGSIYFDEHRADSKHIPFILTPYSIDIHDIFNKLNKYWNLPPPRIIIFAVGEAEDSPSDEYRKMSKKLVKGLVHALNTTEMWLCTDGLNHGFSRDIGKAFENEFSRKSSLEKGVQKTYSVFPETALIGICRRDVLTFSSKFGDLKVPKNVKEATKMEKDINQHYGYFIIVDDTTETEKGLSNFILKFSEHITKHHERSISSDLAKAALELNDIPVMALLLHGKIAQIDLILGHLKLGLPLIVFEGSGGLADLLSYAYYQSIYQPEGINIAEYKESVLKPQVRNKVKEMHPDLSDYDVPFLTEKIFECLRYSKKYDQEFITIIDLDDIHFPPSKLPHYLLKALFKSQASETMKDVHQMKKDLFLAMDWNSAKIATEQVFDRDPTSRFEIDGDTFFRALTKPRREDFISLFLDQGFVIHTYLNSQTLQSLFEHSLNREFFRNVVWENILGFGDDGKITRTFLDKNLTALIEELTGVPSILNSYELDWNCRQFYDDRSPQEAERKAMTALVLWGILSYRVQAVKTLWRHSEQPIHLAIACSIILKKLESYVTDLSLKNEMDKYSKEFSVMAANVMTLCYDSVPCRALDLLDERSRVWSHKALMEMAAFAKNKMFLAHPCCQKQLDNIFMGRFKVRDLPYGDITIPLWLKIILTSFFIFPMYLWIRFETPESKSTRQTGNLKNYSSEQIKISDSKEEEVETANVQKVVAKDPGFFKKIYYFWSAPITKFWVSQVFYLLFLFCFSCAVIWPGCGNAYLDFFTCLWITIMIIDYMYLNFTLYKKYTSMPLVYKFMELSVMIVFLICYAMGRLIWPISFMSPYSAKVMLCIALLYFYYRLIFIALPISAELGPLLYRVKRMIVVDFWSYIRVVVLVIISNGIAIHATIYPDYPLNLELARKAFYDAIISFFLTPADYYGDPDMKCIRLMRGDHRISFIGTPENVCKVGRYFKPTCPNPGFWPYIIGLQYLIILKLIAVVMLFALFSNTARILEEQGKYIWKYQRYELIKHFSNRLTLPPPFCIVTYIYMLCNYIYEKVSKHKKRSKVIKRKNVPHKPEKLDDNDYRYWKSLAMQYYTNTEQEKATEMTTKQRMYRINALSNELNYQGATLRDLEGHLNELQIEIKNAHQYLGGAGLKISVRERLNAKNIPQIFSRISPYPNTMISRFPVSDSHVPWDCNWTTYDPIGYTMPREDFPHSLQPHVDIDIQRKREIEGEAFRMPEFIWNKRLISPGGVVLDRESWITNKKNRILKYKIDSEYLPRNPLGRTGLKGKGCLLRWGPNHYIYIAITRWHETEMYHQYLEIVLMSTNDDLNLPGGYVHTENRYDILHSLFQCDHVWWESDDMVQFFSSLKGVVPSRSPIRKSSSAGELQEKFISEQVKLGYMDDDRNTDQAWCEAEVWHFHYNTKINIDDIFKASMQWYTLNEETLEKVPIGQAAVMHTIAKKMGAVLEIL